MQKILAATLVSGVSASTWANGLTKADMPHFAAGSNMCFDSTKHAIACANATVTVNTTGQKQCAWIADKANAGAGTQDGYMSNSYGPVVAADDACCQAMLDLTLMTWAGAFGAMSSNNAQCYTGSCYSGSDTGNIPHYHLSGTTFTIARATYANILPSDAQMKITWKKLAENNWACLDAANAYMGANAAEGGNQGAVAGLLGAKKAGSWSTLWGTFIGGENSWANGVPMGEMPQLAAQGCYKADRTPEPCSSANATIKVNQAGVNNTYQAQCAWIADADVPAASITKGMLLANYGPTVAADAACCQAVLDYSFTAWAGMFAAFSTNNAKCYTSDCVAANTPGFLNSTWAGPNQINASLYAGILPSDTKMASNMVKLMDNDAACFDAAVAYMGANTGEGLNNGAIAGVFTGKRATFMGIYNPTTTTTTPAPTTLAPTTTVAVGNATTTVASGNATTTAATSAPTTTAPSDSNATTAAPPTTVLEVAASYVAVEQLPANITAADLMGSQNYKDAKKEGLATGLGVASSAVTITGFELSSGRRLRQLSVGAVSVKTSFKVSVADTTAATAMATSVSNAAAAIKTATDTAMAAKTWSANDWAGAVAPTMAAPTMAAASTVTVDVLTSGDWTATYYTDSMCTTASQTAALTGKIGASDCVQTSTSEWTVVSSCSNVMSESKFTASTCAAPASSTGSATIDVCEFTGTEYVKLTCAAPAVAGTTSNAVAAGISTAAVAAMLLI